MGVKLLLRPIPAKGVIPNASHMLSLASLLGNDLCCPSPEGTCAITCQLMKQNPGVEPSGAPREQGPGGMKDLWVVQMSDAKETVFLLNRYDHQVQEVEPSVVKMLERKLDYGAKTSVKFEGRTYNKGDFVMRVYNVAQQAMNQQALIGHCLEIEYLPVSHQSVAEQMLFEFTELLRQLLASAPGTEPAGLITGLEPVRPSYDKYPMPSQAFSKAHAAVAYADMAVRILNVHSRPGEG